MYTLYATLGSGNCFKPFLAMRQLSIPFRTVAVDVLSGQTRQEAFLKINGAGRGRLREGAESCAKALANDILR